jgi:hypothetical protein
MARLADVSPGDLITAQRQNDINDYIEDGTEYLITASAQLAAAGSAPSDGDLAVGRIYANSADNKLYFYNGGFNEVELNEKKQGSLLASMAITDSSSSTSLSGLSNRNYIELENVGSSACFIDLDNSAAITDLKLAAGERIIFEDVSFTDVSAICSTGETTTLNVTAYSGTAAGARTNKEIASISATASSSNHTFTDTTSYKDVVVKNEGSSDCYVEIDSTATTSDRKLEAGKTMIINNMVVSTIAAICDTGESTTVKLLEVH